MTAIAGELLVGNIMPLIAAALARGAVQTVGSEDLEELRADSREDVDLEAARRQR